MMLFMDWFVICPVLTLQSDFFDVMTLSFLWNVLIIAMVMLAERDGRIAHQQ
jgi:hypothetical protein